MHRIAGLLLIAALAAACTGSAGSRGATADTARAAGAATPDSADSAHAAMQARGGMVMGVDQSTSSHVFEDLPDGGRILLRRDVEDPAGVAQIRRHMDDIATAFTAGDFTMPGEIHQTNVPGTDVMAAHRAAITYVVDTIARGGEVRMHSADTAAVRAIHAFLAFQRSDHRAAAHDHM
jgi:hypothetical protein